MFEDVTPKSIWDQVVSELNTDLMTGEGSFLYDVLAPAVNEMYRLYKAMDALPDVFYVNETSGGYLDKMAGIFGVNRKNGEQAAGTVTLTGTAGAVIPAGTEFLTEDGLSFTLDEDVTLTAAEDDADASGSGSLTASAAGTAYNVAEGQIVRTKFVVPGLKSFVAGAASGGTDDETSAALTERLYTALREPATSGNAYQYRQWASEMPGVGAARVIRVWDGAGTVKVILADSNMQPAAAETVSAVAAYIEELRPVGAEVTVVAATGVTVNVSATVTLSSGASLDAAAAACKAVLKEYLSATVRGGFAAVIDADRDTLSDYALTVRLSRIQSLLLDVAGVIDVADVKLNGGAANLTLTVSDVPVLGEVTLNAGS